MIHEVEEAFSNPSALAALSDVSWLTADFMRDVAQSEPEPEHNEGLSGFKDARLSAYLRKAAVLNPKIYGEFFKVRGHLVSHTHHKGGQPKPLHSIDFADEEIIALAHQHGVSIDLPLEVARRTDFKEPLICLVAPEDLRRVVTRVMAVWETPRQGNETIVWYQLARKGVEMYPLYNR